MNCFQFSIRSLPMKNHHEVGHFKNRLMIGLLSLFAFTVMAGQSFAATTCRSCHEMPPLDSADGSRNLVTGAFKGSHQAHVSGSAVASDCVACHNAATSYDSTHSANPGGKNVIKLTTGIYSKGAFFNQTSMPVMGSCSNVVCHSDVYSSNPGTSPDWGSTGNGCTACHSVAIDSTGPATGSHAKHNKTDCSKCHAGATNNTTKPTLHHADGFINVTSGYPITAKHTAGTYTGSCSTATCHANVYGTGTVTTPVWGDTTKGCSACHTVAIGTNGPATGAHAAHAGKACTTCHAAGTTATTAPSEGNGHINGTVDIFYFNYPANVAKHAAGSGYGTCSAAYCHSNGRGAYVSPNWGDSSTGCNFCHPNLGGKHSVHTNIATGAYGDTADKSTGTSYDFGCGNCHPTAIGSHMNGTIDLTLNSTHGGALKSKNNTTADDTGYTQTAGSSVTCAAAYCHSNGMATPTFYGTNSNWYTDTYTGDKCARCHGNSPNTGGKVGSAAHSAHVVGIHVEDIYNGVSRKLPIGGGDTVNAAHGRNNRSTTLNCNICHALTVTSFANDQNSACIGCHTGAAGPKGDAAIADKSKHINGTVDVSFIASTIATKAQVAKTAFAAYTAAASGAWTRNKGIYKTYTSGYDVTKAMLSAAPTYTTANGCAVACHSNNTVHWTDTVTCTSCHTRLK
jgi:predicted CxxxxCH...CXXCH cytochrome family protein